MQYWTVDTIDLQGTIKKLKVKKKDVFNLSNGECIVVDFDDMDSPIGEGQGVLAFFCEILAADCSIFSIHFEKWSDLPATYFNRCFDQFIKEMCKRNAENRKQQIISHIGGSKPNSRRRAEMKAETVKNPGRGQLYLATHKNEDRSYVNEAAKEICEKIELAMIQSITDEFEVSPNDAVGKMLGKEHPKQVRCLGLRVVPNRAFKQTRPRYSDLNASSYNNSSCSSQCQKKYNLMMNAHTQLVNAFKTYMIMKEGTIPE